MSKWSEISETLYSNFNIEETFTKEDVTEIAVLNGIVDKTIHSSTWKALFTHSILQEKDGCYSLLPRVEKVKNQGERQFHGFKFEEFAKEQFNIQPCPEGHYTYKWDGVLNEIPVSIKTVKKGNEIGMASFMRNALNVNDFYLIVGIWEGTKDNIVSIETLFIPGEEWHELFNQEIVEECQNLLTTVSNDACDNDKWTLGRKILAKKWQEQTPNLVRPRFKRDSKNQKRMQCAININDFYNYFIPKYKVNFS